MRILFVSGTTTGGAAQSTHELAASLARRGHDIAVLGRRKPRRDIDADTTRARFPTIARRIGRRVLHRLPIRPTPVGNKTYPMWTVSLLERAVPFTLRDFAPDVVVVNSVYRRAWESIRRHARTTAVPLVLYQREHMTFESLRAWESTPALLITNAETHARRAAGRGVPVEVIPSIVDRERYRVESRRDTVLFVNPITSRGLETAIALASRRPDLRFAFQESWPLSRRAVRELAHRTARLANVEFRRFSSDGATIYRDARILLAPYRSDNRPRVVLEAQFNGIPVLATDYAGLREAVGPGGILVPDDAPLDAWAAALSTLWDDPVMYADLMQRAAHHARRAEIDPDRLTDRFETLLQELVARCPA